MKTNILIIDDDLAVCKQIKYNLQSEVINVYYAMSVKDALLFLVKNNCSLIILELRHSEADGTELLHAIRARNPVPVLVLSYDGSLEHKTKAFKGGADDFLVKPFVTEECVLRAQALIRRYLYLLVSCHEFYYHKQGIKATCLYSRLTSLQILILCP